MFYKIFPVVQDPIKAHMLNVIVNSLIYINLPLVFNNFDFLTNSDLYSYRWPTCWIHLIASRWCHLAGCSISYSSCKPQNWGFWPSFFLWSIHLNRSFASVVVYYYLCPLECKLHEGMTYVCWVTCSSPLCNQHITGTQHVFVV